MPPTTTSDIAATTQEAIIRARKKMRQRSPTAKRSTRQMINKGNNKIRIPRRSNNVIVRTLAEGQDVTEIDRIQFEYEEITPEKRVIALGLTQESQHDSKENLKEHISTEIAEASAEDVEHSLTGEFPNFNSDHDVGQTRVELTIDVLRKARRLLNAVPRGPQGGPPPAPWSTIVSHEVLEQLLKNVGLTGRQAGNNAAPWIMHGISEDMIQNYWTNDQLLGVPVYVSGNMVKNAQSDFICAMFAKSALWWAVAWSWDKEMFRDFTFHGDLCRVTSLYGTGVATYDHHGCTITASDAVAA